MLTVPVFPQNVNLSINDCQRDVKERHQTQLTKLKVTDDYAKEVESEFNKYRTSLYFNRTVASDEGDEAKAALREYKKYVLEDARPKGVLETSEAMFQYNDLKDASAKEPRLLSLLGYQALFEEAIMHSVVKKQQDEDAKTIKHILEEI